MSRKLNWDKARQEDRARRTSDFHRSKPKRGKPPTPPTARQWRYLAALCDELGRELPHLTTRSAATAEITKLKNILAVTGKQ